MESLMKYLNDNHHLQVIIGGDFNAKSPFWGSQIQNKRGNQLLATLSENDLFIMNKGNSPTFETLRGTRIIRSNIDITLTSKKIVDNIIDWNVLKNIKISGDHLPIRFDYNKNLSSKNNHHRNHRIDQQLITTVKWNTTNVDWNEWAKNIKQELILANIHDVNIIKNIEKEENLDYVISQLNNILTKINNKMLPRYKVNILHEKQEKKESKIFKNDYILKKLLKKQKNIYKMLKKRNKTITITIDSSSEDDSSEDDDYNSSDDEQMFDIENDYDLINDQTVANENEESPNDDDDDQNINEQESDTDSSDDDDDQNINEQDSDTDSLDDDDQNINEQDSDSESSSLDDLNQELFDFENNQQQQLEQMTIEQLIVEYRKVRQEYRNRLQSIKELNFLTRLKKCHEQNKNYNVIYKMMNEAKIKYIPAQTLNQSSNPIDTLNEFLEKLFPDDNQNEDNLKNETIRNQTNRWLQLDHHHHHQPEQIDQQFPITSSSPSSPTTIPPPPPITSSSPPPTTIPPPPPITKNELKKAMNKIKDKKAPGFDGFSPIICKKLIGHFQELILAIFNKCLLKNYFPYLWKISIIKIVAKPNRSDYSLAESYRPIGLLPVLGKFLEKIIHLRISALINEKMAKNRQFGFMANLSTEFALFNLKKQLANQSSNDKHVALISLDIKGAFDHSWHPFIINQLIKYNVPTYLIGFIASYLSDRRVMLNFGGHCKGKITNRGTIQGSICGPLFWNLIIDDFISYFNDQINDDGKIYIQAFADDVTAIIRAKMPNILSLYISNFLLVANEWAFKANLKFSMEKTKIMIIKKTIKEIKYPPIQMFNKNQTSSSSSSTTSTNHIIIVEPVDSIKILGVIFDSKLSFRQHIYSKIDQCTEMFRNMIAIIRRKYGLSPIIIKHLYKTILIPTLEYGCLIWYETIKKNVCIRKRLKQLQRAIAQMICQSYRTASFISTTAIANTPPLEIYLIKRASISLAKVTGEYNHHHNQFQLDKKITKYYPSSSSNNNIMIENLFENSYCPETYQRIIIKSSSSNKQSKSKGCCFIAIKGIDIVQVKQFRLGKYICLSYNITTLFTSFIQPPTYIGNMCNQIQCELLAIKKAIEWININWTTTTTNNNETTTIMTNNLATIKSLSSSHRNCKGIKFALEILEMAKENLIIKWKTYKHIVVVDDNDDNLVDDNLVRGADDNNVNNDDDNIVPGADNFVRQLDDEWKLASSLAKSIAKNRNAPIEWNSPTLSTIKKIEHNLMLEKWQHLYDNDKFGTNIKSLFPNIKDIISKSKYTNKWTTQTITGHGQFGDYLSKRGFIDDPKCHLCNNNEIQTVSHLINDCSYFQRLRNDFRDAFNKCNNKNKDENEDKIIMKYLEMIAQTMHDLSLFKSIKLKKN